MVYRSKWNVIMGTWVVKVFFFPVLSGGGFLIPKLDFRWISELLCF